MNTIAPTIKRLRVQRGMTQKEMADRINLSEKAWQNIENGTTKLDIERLTQIAAILEMPLVDLINSQETFYIHKVINENNQVGFAAKEVVLGNDVSESERKLFERMLADKEAQIQSLMQDLKTLHMQVARLIEQVAQKL